MNDLPVILSWGMGVDSSAELFRFINEPECRTFDLSNLTVVTAMTGDEWPETVALCEKYMLPLLNQHNIRFIQVARGGESQKDGAVILHDSHMDGPTTKLHAWGSHKLAEHLMHNGIVPYRGKNKRYCSLKFKGFPIDEVVFKLFNDRPRRRFIGYNAEEQKRIKENLSDCRYLVGYNANELDRIKDKSLQVREQGYHYYLGFNSDEKDRVKDQSSAWRKQVFEFPLIEWGWGRAKVEEYCRENAEGNNWRKSSCVFCPFSISSGGRKLLFDGYREYPEAGALAALIEHFALAMNVDQALYGTLTVPEWLEKEGLLESLELHHEQLANWKEWGVYVVRRIFPYPSGVIRQTNILHRGTQSEAMQYAQKLATMMGQSLELVAHSWRFWTIPKTKDRRPSVEEMFVVCPIKVVERQGRLSQHKYAMKWKEITGKKPDPIVEKEPEQDEQLALF